MPYIEANGGRIYADVVMDPAAVTSRMNPGRIYEQYFNGMSRKTQYEMRKVLNFKGIEECNEKQLSTAWDILLGMLELLGTEQYDEYKSITDIDTRNEILKECIEKEVYLFYRISSKKRPYQITLDSKGTIYEPIVNHCHLSINGKEVITKDKILIAPIYTIVLDKTGEEFLSTSSSKTNHFGIPVGINTSSKNSYPWRNSSTRNISETDNRLNVSYAGARMSAELLDRGSNQETHKHIYKNILNASFPTNIDNVVDKTTLPPGNVAAMDIVYNILNSSGIDIMEVDEKDRPKLLNI